MSNVAMPGDALYALNALIVDYLSCRDAWRCFECSECFECCAAGDAFDVAMLAMLHALMPTVDAGGN